MSVSATHYVVLGCVLKNKNQLKKYFKIDPEDFEKNYYDNPYKEEITKTSSGIHIISDGMNTNYVIIGKILAKGKNYGLDLTELPMIIAPEIINEISVEIIKVDNKIGNYFQNLELQYIVFTHWH